MRQILAAGLGLALIVATSAQAQIPEVETPHGTARVEGTTKYPEVERLMIGDKVVVKPEPGSAQQRVEIEADLGDYLLVRLSSIGNGCYDGLVFVHVGRDEDLRVSDQFGTCGGDLETSVEGETVRIAINSPNPNEGRLEYTYDGRKITERVLGQRESHSPPTASARNWIGRPPREIFEGSDWREHLVSLIGEEAYKEAQDVMDLYSGDGMQLSEGWVAGMAMGNRDSSGSWGAVAIHDDDRRLLVVLGHGMDAPRFWGDPRGRLPAPIVEAIGMQDPYAQ